MKLNYGSFETIFRRYFQYSDELDYLYEPLAEYSDVDKTTIVLLASVRGDDSEIEDVMSINSTTLSKFRTSDRDINIRLKEMTVRCKESYTEEYFEYNLLEYIPAHLYPKMIQDYIKLIDYDHTISWKNKNHFHDLIHHGINDYQVSVFLAAVFRYALVQDNTWHENTVIHAPHFRNPFFVGRKEETKAIQRSLKEHHCATLSGMPGCGKSELALNYVFSLPNDQWIILFVNAETKSGIIDSYRELISYLSLKDDPYQLKEEAIITEIRRWAASEKGFFIFDNADYSSKDKRNMLKKYLPLPADNTRILFTTRNQKPFYDETVITLRELSEKESVEYIMHRAGRTRNKNGAAALAERLSYYPLALSQAAAYLNIYQGISFESYLNKLNDSLDILERYADYSDEQRSVLNTMTVTLQSLLPHERDLLHIAAYFNEDGMHTDLLNRLFYKMYKYRKKEAEQYLLALKEDTELRCTMAARLFPFGFIGYHYAECSDEMAEKIDISLYSHYSMGKAKREDLPPFLQNEEITELADEDSFLKAFRDISEKSMAEFILSSRNYDDLSYFNNIKSVKLHRLVSEILREMDKDLHYLNLAIDIMYDVTPNVNHGVISVYEDDAVLEPQGRALCVNAFKHFNDLDKEHKDRIADIARYVIYRLDFEEDIDLSNYGHPEFEDMAVSDEECDREHMKAIRDIKMDDTIPTTRWY